MGVSVQWLGGTLRRGIIIIIKKKKKNSSGRSNKNKKISSSVWCSYRLGVRPQGCALGLWNNPAR